MAKKGFRKIKYINLEKDEDSEAFKDVRMNHHEGELELHLDIKPADEVKKDSLFSNLKSWITEGVQPTDETEHIEEPDKFEAIDNDSEKKSPINNEDFKPKEEREYLKEKNMEIRTTVIAENVEIVGDVKMEGSLEFYGKITGNIESKGDINMANAAQIEGKLRGNNLSILSGNINGDLSIDKDANLGSQSRVVGDIHAQTLNSSGMIVGNVYVSEKVVLNETSVIEGNIKARELEVKVGAVIRGQIEIDTTK